MLVPWIVGIVVSGIVGILVIAFFLKFLRHNTLIFSSGTALFLA